MVARMLRHQDAASRTDSSTSASGLAASSSRQKKDAGQSTTAPYPASACCTPDISPASACSQIPICPMSTNRSYM
jgi:hypothetical protein